MAVKQRVISMKEFAKAMLEIDSGFAEGVQQFEESFGKADADTLAVLSQVTYFCWGNNEYENDIVEACRAIGTGRPTSFLYHGQVTPKRWGMLNTYVIGVQSWLGIDLLLPKRISNARVQRIKQWLGESDPAKEALAELFLCNLIDQLMDTNFAKLSGDTRPDNREYVDFTPWYARSDNTWYATEDNSAFIEECKQRIRHTGWVPHQKTLKN